MGTETISVELKGDVDVSGAEAERRRLLELIDRPARENYDLDIVGEKITQPALQIFFAMLNEVQERGHSVELGPRAAGLDRCRMDAGKERLTR